MACLCAGDDESTEKKEKKKEKDADVKMNGASETDAAQKKKETALGAQGEETKEAEGRQGISVGPTRDGKPLPVKRPPKETRAWEGPTPVRRNRHDRPQPEWAHDSESEVEEDGCRVLTTADTRAADEGPKEVLGAKGEGTTKGEETKEPATPGEQAAAEEATGKEEAADDPSVFVDVPLSTPTPTNTTRWPRASWLPKRSPHTMRPPPSSHPSSERSPHTRTTAPPPSPSPLT